MTKGTTYGEKSRRLCLNFIWLYNKCWGKKNRALIFIIKSQ